MSFSELLATVWLGAPPPRPESSISHLKRNPSHGTRAGVCGKVVNSGGTVGTWEAGAVCNGTNVTLSAKNHLRGKHLLVGDIPWAPFMSYDAQKWATHASRALDQWIKKRLLLCWASRTSS